MPSPTAFGTGTVTAAALNSNFDVQTTTIATTNAGGQKDQTVVRKVASLAAATVLSARSHAWTQQDDMEVRVLYAYGTFAGAGVTLTATLTVDNGDTRFLVDNTCTATLTSVGAGDDDTRIYTQTDFRTVTGKRMKLLKGVRYRLTASATVGTVTDVTAGVQLRSVRRTG